MDHFDHILNWKLKRGSHPFPGHDGGTCINEAAIVAAGFKYQRVRSVHDMPDCFSRPICKLAMELNDNATEEERQRLLPFVTRLACADTQDVERKRAAFITSKNASAYSFDYGLAVLNEVLAIGRQADTLPADAVRTRFADVQARAAENAVIGKVKSWFERRKQLEPM
jgi:hypothetical protein